MKIPAEPGPEDACYLGFDIGGTKCAVVLGCRMACKKAGEQDPPRILGRYELSTQGVPASELIQQLISAARKLIASLPAGLRPRGAGVSCGSPLDSHRGLILSPPNLPGWDRVPIVMMLKQALNMPVWLLNDADAGALAEWKFGAGQGCSSMVFLTFGTGFGAGLILNSRLYSGIDDGAGEIGHIRISPTGPVGYGKAGSLEGFCSGGGIAQLARMRVLEKTQMGQTVSFCEAAGGPEYLTARIVGDAAVQGDPLAKAILAESGAYLGRGLAILVDLLNPERIIIGSIFARCQPWIWPSAAAVLQAESLERTFRRCRVYPAGLGEQIGDLAALAIAMEKEKECQEI